MNLNVFNCFRFQIFNKPVKHKVYLYYDEKAFYTLFEL